MNGQLGFHVFYEGLVAEVEPYGMAWQAGLRKGSRLLEVSIGFEGSTISYMLGISVQNHVICPPWFLIKDPSMGYQTL